jgi:hypothetical protein
MSQFEAPILSPLNPVLGGVGIGVGMQANVVQDNGAPENEKPVKAADATKRPLWSGGGMGWSSYPGYGPAPRMTPWLAWIMRRYPMVVKIHARITKPVLAGTRSITVENNSGNPELAEEIRNAATCALLPVLGKAMAGALEAPAFGRWLQEIVWDKCDGRIDPVDARSILPHEGAIHVDEYRQFSGYELYGDYRDARYGFLVVHDPHIDPVMGASCNENAIATWFRATKSQENADSIERKASGIQLLISLAEGEIQLDGNGNVIDEVSLGRGWMNAATQGQSVVLPKHFFDKDSIREKPELADVEKISWDRFDWGNIGPSLEAHLSRLQSLDVYLCAAWGLPERSVMEAEHGSRADAEAHSDVVLCISEQMHSLVCQQWDQQITARWMAANYPGVKVKIKTLPAPLADPQQEFLQGLATALVQNVATAPKMAAQLDFRRLLERVEAPMVTPEEAAKAEQAANDLQKQANEQKTKQLQQNKPGTAEKPNTLKDKAT